MTSNLEIMAQHVEKNPHVGGCIAFLAHFGAPEMIEPDKKALGAALKVYPRQHLEAHLVDALADWVRVRVENKKQLSVPQAVRQYLQERADGLPVEGAKPQQSQARIDAVSLVQGLWDLTKAAAEAIVSKVDVVEDETVDDIWQAVSRQRADEIAAKGVR